MSMDLYYRLSAKASMLGVASVIVLLVLGAVDLVALWLDKKWLHWASVVVLIALGVVDWLLRNVEDQRAELAESAFLDRSIRPADRRAAVAILKTSPATIRIVCIGSSDRETAAYCEAIRSLFREAAWEVIAHNWGVVGSTDPTPESGVVLVCMSPCPPQSETAKSALTRAGVKFAWESTGDTPGRGESLITLEVAQKPAF